MAYSIRRKPENTKEIQYANRFAKLLTEDFNANLEAIGFHLVRNHAPIIWHRLEVVSLTAGEEYDRLMGEMLGANHVSTLF